MKKVAPKPPASRKISPGGRKTGRGSAMLRPRTGGNGHRTKRPAPTTISYDAEDIEEANRIGAALCRQHAL